MNESERDLLAEKIALMDVLAEHEWHTTYTESGIRRCECGHRSRESHNAHVADVLLTSGYVSVTSDRATA